MWLVAAGACVPVAAAAVLLTQTGTHQTAQLGVKPVSYAGGMPMGGFGRGGYPMTGGAVGQQAVGTGGTVNSANAAATSTNWSGYAAAGNPGTFTSVSSSWTQPAVTCGAQQTFSSFWVGLDGDGTQSVEQTGTEADCTNGAAAYSGWWEMFPAAPVFYNEPVKPGDAMSASVTANGSGAFTLTLSDQTQNWTQTTQQTSQTAQLGSAEVIAEAPSSQNGVLPLSNFGTVNFTNARADNAPIGNANADSLTMVSAAGVTEATPSALTGGNAFSVTFGSNGTTTGAGSPAPASPAPTSPAATSPVPASSAPTAPAGTSPDPTGTGGHHHHHWFF
ncbi:MAG TPA: G1 family glutamic endopeptidase [Streptosporangiaceae bacterium]|nr:G1 family glutamic endopeptidase [Streptosporangiaceae bacterium]